jgi:hypothetical protein
MADEIDVASNTEQLLRDIYIKAARRDLVPGIAGECHRCGEYSGRLVGNTCAPCRDKFKLP